MKLSPADEERARQCGKARARHMVALLQERYDRVQLWDICPAAASLHSPADVYATLRHWIYMQDRRVRNGGEPWIPVKRAMFLAAAVSERNRAQQAMRRAVA